MRALPLALLARSLCVKPAYLEGPCRAASLVFVERIQAEKSPLVCLGWCRRAVDKHGSSRSDEAMPGAIPCTSFRSDAQDQIPWCTARDLLQAAVDKRLSRSRKCRADRGPGHQTLSIAKAQ